MTLPCSLISLTILFTLLSLISNLKANSAGEPVPFNAASLKILNFRLSFSALVIN